MNMRLTCKGLRCALALAFATPLASHTRADLPPAPVVPGEILVGFTPTKTGLSAASLTVTSIGSVAGYESRLNAARVKLKNGVSIAYAIARMQATAGVAYAEANHVVHACADPNDPAYSTQQYAPQITQANLSWDVWKPRNRVSVAIIDTGIEDVHPDLKDVMLRDANGNVVGWNTLTNTSDATDDAGHGTHCSGIALAHINDGTGLAGIAGWNPNVAGSDTWITLMPVKALDSAGNGTDASLAAGITWAADHGAQVISVSSSTTTFSTTLSNAVAYAWGKGCVIVAAAGNDGSSALEYPAAYTNVISVAATDSTDTLLFYSQYGSWIKCAAPGTDIYSTWLGGTYSGLSGTSTAAPHVAAEAAAILAQNPTLTNSAVGSLICGQVDPVTPYLNNTLGTGVGRINVYKAIVAAGDGLPNITAVSFNPSTIANGTTGNGTVLLGGPAPAGGTVITLSSSNTSIATVPSSVTVPAGATSANFTASGKVVNANSNVTITGSDGVNRRSTVLTVDGSVASSISISPTQIGSGASYTGTVTLDNIAPTGGAVVQLSDNSSGLLNLPASVTVPAGARSANFSSTAGTVSRRISVTVNATFNGATASTSVMLNQLMLSSITVSPSSVLGGVSATGTVTLTAAAPTGGVAVSLTSSLTTAATVPASVTVPAGSSSANFTITTYAVSANKTSTITATAGGVSVSASISVTPLLKSVSLSPASVAGGVSSKGTVTLAAPAPATGTVVNLSSNNSVATVPSSVTVAAGATTATFTVSTSPVLSNTAVTITAANAGTKVTAKLTVKLATAYKLVLSPTSLTGGASSTATVSLTGPAPAGGATVTLSSNSTKATVPGSVTIPAGASSTTFTISTSPVPASVTATISATKGTTISAKLTVKPPVLSRIALSPTSLTGGASSTATIALTGPAPAGGLVISLKSSSTVATLPSSVTIPAGSSSASVTVSTSAVAAKVSATISATLGSTTKSAALTINP